MRRSLLSAMALVLAACSVVPDYARPSPSPTPPPPTATAMRAITYEVTPFEIRSGASAVSKTVVHFSNPNAFMVDWAMVVRLKDKDGVTLRDERIGSLDAPVDRSDPKWQNWFFPIPSGDSWTVVRFETVFARGDVLDFSVSRKTSALSKVANLKVTTQVCSDMEGLGVGCRVIIETPAVLPSFTRLHLVVIVRSKDASRRALRGLMWRPELSGAATPWLRLAIGQELDIRMQDSYPTPKEEWEYEVFAHAYEFAG
jgi:hypothetical protein